jgi:hypothetical protein
MLQRIEERYNAAEIDRSSMSNYWKSLCFKTLMAGGGLSIIEPADGFRTKTEHGLNQSLPRGSKDESLTVTRWHDAARLLLDR